MRFLSLCYLQGWNHIINDGSLPLPQDVLVHITWPQLFPEPTKEMNCTNLEFRKKAERPCKYLGLEFYMESVIGTKQYKSDLDFNHLFIKEKNGCQQVGSWIDRAV